MLRGKGNRGDKIIPLVGVERWVNTTRFGNVGLAAPVLTLVTAASSRQLRPPQGWVKYAAVLDGSVAPICISGSFAPTAKCSDMP